MQEWGDLITKRSGPSCVVWAAVRAEGGVRVPLLHLDGGQAGWDWSDNLLEPEEGLGVGNVPELVDRCVAVGGALWLHHRPADHPGDVPQAGQGEGDVLLGEGQGRCASEENTKTKEDKEKGGGGPPHPGR